jgi:RNA polymerase sigma-70 factor (ECF subfamily)
MSRSRLQLVPPSAAALAARTDDELMELSQAGVREAFAVLVERYALRLVSACTRFVNDGQAGRELAQETWLTIWAEREKYRAEGRFAVWLYTLARNRCRNHLRHRGIAQRHAELPGVPPPADSIELDRLLERERARRVQRALMRLPQALREALVLRFAQELRYDEIAAVLRIGESTLRSRVHHGLKQLRRWLEEES